MSQRPPVLAAHRIKPESHGVLHHPTKKLLGLILGDPQGAGRDGAIVKDRFSSPQTFTIGILVKEANVDSWAPFHRLLAGRFPIARVVVLVLQLGHPFFEEVVRVVEVERHTGAEDVDKGETLVLNGALDDGSGVSDVAAVSTGYIGSPVHDR